MPVMSYNYVPVIVWYVSSSVVNSCQTRRTMSRTSYNLWDGKKK